MRFFLVVSTASSGNFQIPQVVCVSDAWNESTIDSLPACTVFGSIT